MTTESRAEWPSAVHGERLDGIHLREKFRAIIRPQLAQRAGVPFRLVMGYKEGRVGPQGRYRSAPTALYSVKMGATAINKNEPNTIGLTDEQLRAVVHDVDPELVRIGHEVLARQKTETFLEAWRNHWGAAMWSLFLSTALFMEGYDNSLVRILYDLYVTVGECADSTQMSTFFGMPQFQQRFGSPYKGKLVIPAAYQGGLLNIAKCGQLIGLVITGICQERYGSRKTYIWGMAAMTASIFLAVFAINLDMLLGAELAMGIPWGMFRGCVPIGLTNGRNTRDRLCG